MVRVKRFWLHFEQMILMIVALAAVGGGSYFFGLIAGEKNVLSPVSVTYTEGSQATLCSAQCEVLGVVEDSALESDDSQVVFSQTEKSTCVLLGSQNGSKYYSPSCKALQRIKSENLICFGSEQEARKKGYTKSKSC